MKKLLISLIILGVISQCIAQSANRHIKFEAFGKDSLNIYLSDTYFLIDDTCASIIRYTHFNYDTKKFVGNFKDVSKANLSLVINEGAYNPDGQKEGDFILHYLNGNLKAKGKFHNDKFIGNWSLYYEDGSPELTFNVEDGITTILDAWNSDKVKVVSNGNGHFVVDNGTTEIVWHGKITNGRPDSTWVFSQLSDPHSNSFTEYFKKGKFVKGKNPMLTYDDASHFVLVDEKMLPITNAERLSVSPLGCDPIAFHTDVFANSSRHKIENAHYFNGTNAFTGKVNEAMAGFKGVHVANIGAKIIFNAVIDEKGNIGNFISSDTFDHSLSRQLISYLEMLPQLVPATYDGKPAKENFRITFFFNNYSYSYNYEFLKVIPLTGNK